jgi:hypothetical protein
MKRLRRPPRADDGVAARVVPAVLQVAPLAGARQVRQALLRLRVYRPAVALQVRQAPRVRRVVLAVDKGADPVVRRLPRPSPRQSIK